MADPHPGTPRPGHWLHLVVLGFVAGFVDVCGYIQFGGVFTAHVTGNIALLGVEVVRHSPALLPRLAAVPVYVLGAAVARLVASAADRVGLGAGRPLLVLEIALLVAAIAIASGHAPAPALLPAMLTVAAMAVQSAAPGLAAGWSTLTTGMTANLTVTVAALLHRVAPGLRPTPEVDEKQLRERGLPLAGFAAGAGCGGLGALLAGFGAAVLPTCLLAALLFMPPRPPRPPPGDG